MSSPTSVPSPPADFDFDVERHSTPDTSPQPGTSAAPSPPNNTLSDYSYASSEVADSIADNESMKEEDVVPKESVALNETETEQRLSRLQTVLQQSAIYSRILKERMDEEKAKQLARQAEKAKAGKKRGRPALQSSPAGKRKKGADGQAVATSQEQENDESPIFQQPSLVTGAKLKPYQLEGLQWMVSLDQNGMSGILADEMGLGKTLQTISFSAYLKEHGNLKPFLVVCPLSVLHNWHDEYKKFAPEIPVVIYHGTPEERAELRRTVMALPGRRPKAKAPRKAPAKRKPGRPPKAKAAVDEPTGRRKSGRPKKAVARYVESDDDDDEKGKSTEAEQSMNVDEEAPEPEKDYTMAFPVVLTTYEMIIKDRMHLQHYNWGYIVVDEGHRLKNMDCRLMKEIKKYSSAGRMILTGTPLHNNLAELWSLLNFILPDIFNDIDTFQEWFNLPELQSALPTSQSSQIISTLHAILKPFLLRRLKVDVEMSLPPKKEYVLYAPLSVRQREAYDRVLDGGLRRWLIQGGTGSAETQKVVEETPEEPAKEEEEEEEEKNERRVSRRLKKHGRKSYDVDGDDDEYFDMLESDKVDERGVRTVKTKEEEEAEEAKIGREHQMRTKTKQVNNMKLQNTVMQLRKVCSHPFLFDWPIDPQTMEPILGEELVNASGKMMILDRLLRELFKRGHKVLLFSQFTTMLDIIEDWAVDFMKWNICRIDGKSAPLERREQMNRFQTGGDDPSAPRLFLLSTRAGGLGINLVAADTVIFYDQDWNPQMDAQAQDRAHRIGQKRPVLIFRLVSAHTVETKIMQRAGEKRKLEALVIAKGKFKMPAVDASTSKRETIAELAASLLRLEGEKIEVVPDTKEGKQSVLSDEDLDLLLDRSPEVFAERADGWTGGASAATSGTSSAKGKLDGGVDHAAMGAGKKAAFAVYQAPVEEGSDALAKMMGEDGEDS
ncbi:unnamed protein product [Cyclocybe aegerita]|uniref:Uncharacterized protein n=1 Tax=Cyclocybe aegerita TaxID=1973307 RepID=A0A8S0WSC6_CYCAE|nr:unnamed protein product [Cyclocybe aegerita]